MKRLVLVIFAFFLAACAPPGGSPIYPSSSQAVFVWHDDEHSVTCWVFDGDRSGGIFCMTDREINGK